jgi:osmotically-inducible protein OsmY
MPNSQKKRQIENWLKQNTKLTTQDIIINVEGEKAVVQGSVPHIADKMAIIDNVLDTDGVSEVDDQLVIVESTAENKPLEKRIYEIIESQDGVDPFAIDVIEQGDTVTLQGSVTDYGQKKRIEDLVSSVSGVLTVNNQLTVAPERSEADQTIAEEVVGMLENRDDVQTGVITVEVEEGIVTLSGHVPTWTAKNSAMEAAGYVSGVTRVVDDLIIDELV